MFCARKFAVALCNSVRHIQVSAPLSAALILALIYTHQGAGGAERHLKKVIFVAGGPSHGFMQHDYLAGSKLLAERINKLPGFEAVVYYQEWPPREAFESASAVVIYADGGADNIAAAHKDQLLELSLRGVGIGAIHYALEVPKESAGTAWLSLIGGYFETFHSVNPEWDAQFDLTRRSQSVVANGVKPFHMRDEWYFHMRFRPRMRRIKTVLSAIPPDSARMGVDDPHGGNAEVRSAIGTHTTEHLLWISGNLGRNGAARGRGFGCTGGHYHQNWAHDQFRKVVLNAISWIAGAEIPSQGIESMRPTVDELLSNRDPDAADEQIPAGFDRSKLRSEIEEMNKPPRDQSR
jgi:type 1 glutamine amidotransferase